MAVPVLSWLIGDETCRIRIATAAGIRSRVSGIRLVATR
jgi:hypothetical protein